MENSLRGFMSQIIDYAGLYPPASLSLTEAFHNFVQYQTDDDLWMLSRFVIPAKRLSELNQFAEIFPKTKLLGFTALGRGAGQAEDEFLENLKLDLADVRAFCEAHKEQAFVDMFETPLPIAVLNERSRTLDLMNRSAEALNKNGLTVFYEAPFTADWQTHAENLIRALRKLKDKHVGFKLRTGGVTADAFPTTAQVAWAIVAVRDAGIPMKCTAGLHHPLRHFNASVQTKMHGFINVFGAGLLAVARSLDQTQVQEILEDENPVNFTFDEKGFAWKELHATHEQIKLARQAITSFGSCSFDEPRQDLRALRLL